MQRKHSGRPGHRARRGVGLLAMVVVVALTMPILPSGAVVVPTVQETSPGPAASAYEVSTIWALYDRNLSPGSSIRVLRSYDRSDVPVPGVPDPLDEQMAGTSRVEGALIVFEAAVPLTVHGSRYRVEVNPVSANNILGPPHTWIFTIDRTIPPAPSLDPIGGTAKCSTVDAVVAGGTATPLQDVEVIELGSEVKVLGRTRAGADGSYRTPLDIPVGQNGVSHTIVAQTFNRAGTRSPYSSPVTFTQDTVRPAAVAITQIQDTSGANVTGGATKRQVRVKGTTPAAAAGGEAGTVLIVDRNDLATAAQSPPGAVLAQLDVTPGAAWTTAYFALPREGTTRLSAVMTDGCGHRTENPAGIQSVERDTIPPPAPQIHGHYPTEIDQEETVYALVSGTLDEANAERHTDRANTIRVRAERPNGTHAGEASCTVGTSCIVAIPVDPSGAFPLDLVAYTTDDAGNQSALLRLDDAVQKLLGALAPTVNEIVPKFINNFSQYFVGVKGSDPREGKAVKVYLDDDQTPLQGNDETKAPPYECEAPIQNGTFECFFNLQESRADALGLSQRPLLNFGDDGQIYAMARTYEARGTDFITPVGKPTNVSSAVVACTDTQAPGQPVVTSPVHNSSTSSTSITVSGQSDPSYTCGGETRRSRVEVRDLDTGIMLCSALASTSGSFSIPCTLQHGGENRLEISHKDPFENFGLSVERTVIVGAADTTPPVLTETFPTFTDPAANVQQFSAVFNEEISQGTIQIFNADGQPIAGSTSVFSNVVTWQYASTTLREGTYKVVISGVKDAAPTPNTWASSCKSTGTPCTFVVDDTEPDRPVIESPTQGQVLDSRLVTVTGIVRTKEGLPEKGGTVDVFPDMGQCNQATTNNQGRFSTTCLFTQDGPHTVRATAADKAGNASLTSDPVSFSVVTTEPPPPPEPPE